MTLKCPDCGGSNLRPVEMEPGHTEIVCDDCFCHASLEAWPDDAVRAWLLAKANQEA